MKYWVSMSFYDILIPMTLGICFFLLSCVFGFFFLAFVKIANLYFQMLIGMFIIKKNDVSCFSPSQSVFTNACYFYCYPVMYIIHCAWRILLMCTLYFFLDLPIVVRQVYSIYCSAMDCNFGSEFYLHD